MQIEIRPGFNRDIRRLRGSDTLHRVARTIADLEDAPAITTLPNVRRLTSARGHHYRIRVGRYRIGVTIEGEVAVLVRILHRRDFYRRFP